MVYSEDLIKQRLTSLSETQDSIVTAAHLLMFYRKHAEQTAALWMARLVDSPTPAKRIPLLYLANEIVQQARARSKLDFVAAWEPLITEATTLTYKGAGSDIRDKTMRLVEVWRQRKIFDPAIQDVLEQKLKEIDQQRTGKSGGGRLGGSLFGGGGAVPTELDGVAKSQTALTKNEATVKPATEKANLEYSGLMGPDSETPSPPVHAHKLRELVKTLSVARGAVEQSIKVRKELIEGLEKLIETNKETLASEEATSLDFTSKFNNVERKKDEVEDGIVRGVTSAKSQNGAPTIPFDESTSPEIEGFTPPPPEPESFTPQEETTLTGDPAPFFGEENSPDILASTTGAESIREKTPNFNEPDPAFEPTPALYAGQSSADKAADDFLNSLSNSGVVRPATHEFPTVAANGETGDPRLKRRKTSHAAQEDQGIDEAIFGSAGMDEEGISAMLNDGADGAVNDNKEDSYAW